MPKPRTLTKRTKSFLRGFTLAELLIVVVILGVLGSIAMPKFYPQKEKAVVAEAVAMLSAIRQGELAYRLENSGYKEMTAASTPDDWGMLGIDTPNMTRFTYTVTNTDDTAFATATRSSAAEVPADYRGDTLSLMLKTGVWRSESTHPFRPQDAH